MSNRTISATTTVDAPPEKIWALLVDPAKHPVLDGGSSVKAARDGNPERLELGSEFGMDMKIGAPYKITNKVVEYEEGSLIAWRHFAGHRWRWELTPLGDGRTQVTETFDYSRVKPLQAVGYRLAGFLRANKRNIQATLDRLPSVLAREEG